MNERSRTRFAVLLLPLLAGCERAARPPVEDPTEKKAIEGPEVDRLRVAMNAVASLHKPMGEPLPGDWLDVYKESGQTFDQYLASKPRHPTRQRRTIYIRPLGSFTPAQDRIVSLTADYMELFFNLPVTVEPAADLSGLPQKARRTHPSLGEQLQTGYLMGSFLKTGLPRDAAARVGLIASNLYPNEQMNFVFGQASLRDRVGVWSLHYLGEPEKGGWDFHLCLLRTIKIAAHETGHMFSLRHCTKYECIMNGSNSLDEVDQGSVEACPECMAKICWATDCDPARRYKKLATFWRAQGMVEVARFFDKSAEVVGADQP